MTYRLQSIVENLHKFRDAPAFCIANTYYTYGQLEAAIAGIEEQLTASALAEQSNIGILTYDDLETYASVLAVLLSGHTFVPLNPSHPTGRNESIIVQADIAILLSSNINDLTSSLASDETKLVHTAQHVAPIAAITRRPLVKTRNAYILFTSGSTGIPKGVPITIENLESFLDAFFHLGFNLDHRDRFIQMFDMTFDLSIMSYMVPLCIGACVYTLPFESIKYMQVYRLLEEHDITFALLVPSIISHLRPYFEEIRLEKMRYCLFCGEALYEDVTMEWAECVPNADIVNVYGPTEATIFCTSYPIGRTGRNKSLNGILCIGKPMANMELTIIDEGMHLVKAGEKGELCLCGLQVTPGYWKNEQKNEEAFIMLGNKRYYRTGDLCFSDEDGDVYYSGRSDSQVKIQGFRVELGEIEQAAREFLKIHAVVAVARQNESTTWQIFLFIENYTESTNLVHVHLKNTLPAYMLPAKIIATPQFPLNSNGKIDRKALMQTLS